MLIKRILQFLIPSRFRPSYYTQNCKDFSKKPLRKSLPIYKSVEKIVAVVNNVVMCMEDNCIFLQFRV